MGRLADCMTAVVTFSTKGQSTKFVQFWKPSQLPMHICKDDLSCCFPLVSSMLDEDKSAVIRHINVSAYAITAIFILQFYLLTLCRHVCLIKLGKSIL
jgi:hypothetical protein